MYSDSVLEELWRVKDDHAAKYGDDIHAMAAALREKQSCQNRKVVSFAADDFSPYGPDSKSPSGPENLPFPSSPPKDA